MLQYGCRPPMAIEDQRSGNVKRYGVYGKRFKNTGYDSKLKFLQLPHAETWMNNARAFLRGLWIWMKRPR
jgi:hypothetical protein